MHSRLKPAGSQRLKIGAVSCVQRRGWAAGTAEAYFRAVRTQSRPACRTHGCPDGQPAVIRYGHVRTDLPVGTILSGPARVIDGGTLVISGCNIRIAGIDTPELDHPCGRNAKWALVGLCRNNSVRAEAVDSPSYNRTVARCRLTDGRDLAAQMVRAGMALAWPTHSGGRYRHPETADARKPLWRADARQKGRWPPSNPTESGPADR